MVVSSTVSSVAAANNQFAIDLYKNLIVGNQQNTFFSPFSITAALAMINVGASGTTKSEILSGMRLPSQTGKNAGQDINSAYQDLFTSLKIRTKGDSNSESNPKFKFTPSRFDIENNPGNPQLNLANRVFLQTGTKVKDHFANTLKNSYNSTFGEVDFAGNPDAAKNTINTWVEDVTNHKIKNLLTTVSSSEKLILVSAIYFKAGWADLFDPKLTKEKTFFANGKNSVQAKFMNFNSYTKFGYAEFPELKATAISIPYMGFGLNFLVILPNDKSGLDQLQNGLTPTVFDPSKYGSYFEVNVSLPKFRVEGSFTLAKNLKDLGIKTAFTSAADFSGISSPSPRFNDVIHKSFIEIDEKGTEAAAATAIMLAGSSFNPTPPAIKTFNADHPFLFAIQHTRSNVILFLGRLEDPTQH